MAHTTQFFALALVTLALSAGATNAAADTENTLAVVVAGVAESELATAAKDTFTTIGWRATLAASTEELQQCLKLRKEGSGCLANLLGDVGYVASFAVSADEASKSAVVTASLLRVADGESVVIPVRRFCQCSVEQTASVAEVVKKVSQELVSEIQSQDSPSYVDIQCEPSDAILTIDGVRTGRGKRKVKPGEVTVVASREGYESKRYTVAVAPGELVQLPIDLRLIERSNLTLLAVALGVAGGLTAGAGLFLIDSKSSVDGDQRLPEGSRVTQVATVSVGLGLIAAAGVTYYIARQRNAEKLESARGVAVVPASDGFTVALSGRF